MFGKPVRDARWIRLIAAALLLFTSSLPAGSQTPTPPPYSWPRSHSFHVQHYRIALTVDIEGKSIAGETTITLTPYASGLKEIELDAGEMTIKSVKTASGQPLKFRYEGNEKLYMTLDKSYDAGAEVSIAVEYTAQPKKGLTFISPTPMAPNRPYQVWSQGEAQTNHYWFPCYDYPNDKSTTDTIVTVPDKYMVISNGALVDVEPDPSRRTKTFHWRMDHPFSSYLASIIVGDFDELKQQFKNIPVLSYVNRGKLEEAEVSVGKIGQMVSYFSERIGVEYPYPKYAQSLVRDFNGGMENISATTLTDEALHDKRAGLDISSDDLISHELSHQWFGDLLTCRDWGELWLNESFATLFASIWNEHDKGKDEYLYDMLKNQRQYFQVWYGGNRRPVVTERYDDPDAIFDVYAYQRGGATLNLLRFVMGDDLFWKGINHYVKKYQFQNVDTAAFSAALAESTGMNLDWFFDEWIYRMGHPDFEISSKYDESAHKVTLSVKQTQKPDDKKPWFRWPDFFTSPADIAITTSAGEKIHRVMIDAVEKTFEFEVDSKPLIVNFDRGNYLIKRVTFNRGDQELAYQVLHDADVTGRLRAVDELRQNRSETGAKALVQAAKSDSFWGVRFEAASALWLFNNDIAKEGLQEAAKDHDARVRRAALDGLGNFKDPKLAGVFEGIIKSDPSYFCEAAAARALAGTAVPEAHNILVGMLAQSAWGGIAQAGALTGLQALKAPDLGDLALKYAGPENPVALRTAALRGIAEAAKTKSSPKSFDVLVQGLDDGSAQVVLASIVGLGNLKDPRAIPALEQLAKKPDLPPFVAPLVQATIKQIKAANKDH